MFFGSGLARRRGLTVFHGNGAIKVRKEDELWVGSEGGRFGGHFCYIFVFFFGLLVVLMSRAGVEVVNLGLCGDDEMREVEGFKAFSGSPWKDDAGWNIVN